LKNASFEIKIIGAGSKNRGIEFMCLTLSNLVSRLVPSILVRIVAFQLQPKTAVAL